MDSTAKLRQLSLAVFAAGLATAFAPPHAAAQTTAKDVAAKTAEAWNTLKAYTVDKKNDAQAYGRKLVSDTNQEIKALEREAAKASGEVKAEYQREIKVVKAKSTKAVKQLDAMGKASGEAWDGAKDGFADAYRDLRESFSKAKAKIKS